MSLQVEFCNNANNWPIVMSLVDAQKKLAHDAWSEPGSFIDADMLTVGCNDNPLPGSPCSSGTPLTVTEQYSQMSLWCAARFELSVPLLLAWDVAAGALASPFGMR